MDIKPMIKLEYDPKEEAYCIAFFGIYHDEKRNVAFVGEEACFYTNKTYDEIMDFLMDIKE